MYLTDPFEPGYDSDRNRTGRTRGTQYGPLGDLVRTTQDNLAEAKGGDRSSDLIGDQRQIISNDDFAEVHSAVAPLQLPDAQVCFCTESGNKATTRTVRLLSEHSRWDVAPSSEAWTPRVSGRVKDSRVRSRQ
ncbi:hypothetical protein EYF80_028885 [Liparis tanakae]|uniref:Uncharacterized protein n=1 Tax=Liparis tanakae TaxID=230148 RepID=A0A4Z2H5V6_9TELE|nr:hypothetical protein EYF80_028885 [Liparis tanakae]